jgi:excisionase family DNA binding protein
MIQNISTTLQPEELENLIANSVYKAFETYKLSEQSIKNDEKQILTRQETAVFLSISLPTLHDYTKRGLITAHRLGSKVRYKLPELQAALIQIRTTR